MRKLSATIFPSQRTDAYTEPSSTKAVRLVINDRLDDNSQLKNDRKNGLLQEFLFRCLCFFPILSRNKSQTSLALELQKIQFENQSILQSSIRDPNLFSKNSAGRRFEEGFLTVLAKLQLRPIKIELFGLVRREDLRLSEEQQRANWASSFFRTYGKMARE